MQAAQIIDEDETLHEDALRGVLEGARGDAVRTVAIMGPQSSGKSTLLNALFGTRFGVMADAERRQTTRGIWAAHVAGGGVLVLDVEGTDGRERGEACDFERKSALFALAAAEVLIVNVWEHAVGLYHGANMGLLRTVLDAHAQLCGSAGVRTTLLFVVRDCAGTTPESNLSSVLLDGLGRVWATLPPRRDGASLSDALRVCFAFLPHKVLQPDAFAEAVARLRARFANTLADDYLFERPLCDAVGRDDVAVFVRSVWAKVRANRDLDLPTERELLAQYRCDEIASEAAASAAARLADARRAAAAGGVRLSLAAEVRSAVGDAAQTYAQQTARYAPSVAARRWAETAAALRDAACDLARRNAENGAADALAAFGAATRPLAERRTADVRDACRAVAAAQRQARVSFAAAFAASDLSGLSDLFAASEGDAGADPLSLDECRVRFERALAEAAQSVRAAAVASVGARLVRETGAALSRALSSPAFGMGAQPLAACLAHELAAASAALCAGLTAALDEAELPAADASRIHESLNSDLASSVGDAVRAALSEARVGDRASALFERRFLRDAAGLPRLWLPGADVAAAYAAAVQAVAAKIAEAGNPAALEEELSALPEAAQALAAAARVSSAFLAEDAAQALAARLAPLFERRYVEAQRATLATQTHVPLWMWALLLFLGWNEILAVLRSPLYLFLALAAAAAFLALRVLGGTPHLRVLLSMARALLRALLVPAGADAKPKDE